MHLHLMLISYISLRLIFLLFNVSIIITAGGIAIIVLY